MPPPKQSTALVKVDPASIARLKDAAQQAAMVQAIADPIEQMFSRADAVSALRSAIKQPGILDSIISLQGTKLGFRTDRDRDGGYGPEVVGDAIIEALCHGIMPTGNEFNIIGGNFYATREGFEGLIRRRGADIGLSDVMIVPGIPKMQQGGATIDVTVSWKIGGKPASQTIPLAIKVNAGMGADAIAGKAKRKAMAWLWNTVTGSAMADADVDDTKPDLSAGAIPVTSSPLEDATVEKKDAIPMPPAAQKATKPKAAKAPPATTTQPPAADPGQTQEAQPQTPYEAAVQAIQGAGLTVAEVESLMRNKVPPTLRPDQPLSQASTPALKQIVTHIAALKLAVEAVRQQQQQDNGGGVSDAVDALIQALSESGVTVQQMENHVGKRLHGLSDEDVEAIFANYDALIAAIQA
jgi:hypothetical protein